MQKLKMLFLLSLLSVPTAGLLADTATSATTAPVIDPTLVFFTSLSKCTPGVYMERNELSTDVGTDWLKHQIHGVDGGSCQVTLATPDGRVLQCSFNLNDLVNLSEQRFLVGIVTANSADANKDALAADLYWSELKNDNCGF